MEQPTRESAVMMQKQIYNKTYDEALRANQSETHRWNAYRMEHQTLKDTLRMYQEAPRADILIPMGSKALIPGQLYHTGELLVSHGGGYFSECSSEQAQTIADRRIRLADQMLQQYDREHSLYSDKLSVPYINEAFETTDGGREIIELYDEEAEARWREEHRCRVRESKRKEAQTRSAEANDQNGNELMEKLEEMELLEELEQEIDQLDIPCNDDGDDGDQLGRLMRGEIRLNEKKRTSYQREHGEESPSKQVPSNERIMLPEQNSLRFHDDDAKDPVEAIETTDDEESNGSEEEDISPGFSQLLNETKNSTNAEKIQIFQTKLSEVRERLYLNSFTIDEKVDLYQLYEELDEALDFLRPTEIDDELEGNNKKQAKKIKFADHDQIKLIDDRHSSPYSWNNRFASTKNTVFLPIVHSPDETFPEAYRQEATKNEIICPADIYRLFKEEVHSAIHSPTKEIKSILKNKRRLDKETLPSERATRPSKKDILTPDDVLGDIVEHSNNPEGTRAEIPAPQEKKKVSRFKQQRH